MSKKLGIGYNVFDGEELLPYSLFCIRDVAEYIVVIYQTTSNYGSKNENLVPFLKNLYELGYVDELVEYEPQLKLVDEKGSPLKTGSINEQIKRNLALEKCLANGCDVFSTMDTDELYDKSLYKKAYEEFVNGNYDSSFCQMQTYYKSPTMRVTPPETYYVPLFYNISGRRKKLRFEFIHDYNVYCDGTRMIRAGFPKMFSRDEIEMHHFSYVRNSLQSKVVNSSAQRGKREVEMIVKHWENWQIGDKGIFIGNQIFDLEEVVNQFNINYNDYTHKIDFPNFVTKRKV